MDAKIGFIGQGFVGKNCADDFEARGFKVTRYGLESPYSENKEAIGECDIVFIAVPTPTRPAGFDDSIVRNVIKLVGKGKIAVIKSTVLPGRTRQIQEENPEIFVLHSPEFLTEANASFDAANPTRNIVGIPLENKDYREKAKQVMDVLPGAPYEIITSSESAEIIKYGSNSWLYTKVVYMNLMYDLSSKLGAEWEDVKVSLAADPRFGKSHLEPMHESGRGAGGHCFIKDFKALIEAYKNAMPEDVAGIRLLEAFEKKNNDLLITTGKDLDILEQVYGQDFANNNGKKITHPDSKDR